MVVWLYLSWDGRAQVAFVLGIPDDVGNLAQVSTPKSEVRDVEFFSVGFE